jgi:hypothetical protein
VLHQLELPRMDDDISKLLREMKDISVSFTPEDLIQNMTSIGHIKTTNTNPHSNNLEMSSSMRAIFSRISSRLTRHCISDPFDKQASNKSFQLSTVLTNTNPHSPVNFQTGKIKVLFTIDLGAVKPGETRYLSGIFFNDDVIVTDNVNNRIVMYDDQGVQRKELRNPPRTDVYGEYPT